MPPNRHTFPEGFLWGVSTSAYQIEGAVAEDGRGISIWDTFSHTSGRIERDETGDLACDHYHRWREDQGLMSELGVNAYRFSVAWPRVLPEGRGPVNRRGLDFYDRLVDGLLERGIEPFPTLYHWDLPQALEDEGGWPERSTAEAFADYAHVVGERLGDRVHWWITHNEPFFAAVSGYYLGDMAPGRQEPVAAFHAAHNLLVSHGLAVRALRETSKVDSRVGIALSLNAVHPATSDPVDVAAARRFDAFVNRFFLDPIYRRTYPADLEPLLNLLGVDFPASDMDLAAERLDFLGVNYYTRVVARHDENVPFLEASQITPEGSERSLMWEIYPQGMYEVLVRLRDEYQVGQILVTENGMPGEEGPEKDGEVHDPARVRYLARHLGEVHRAIERGIPVGGYFVWSLLDNFEWAYGYRMRFGLVHVDFTTQKRTPKGSATWYQEVIREGLKEDWL